MSLRIGWVMLAAMAAGCCLAALCPAQTGRVYTPADYAQAEKFMEYNTAPLDNQPSQFHLH